MRPVPLTVIPTGNPTANCSVRLLTVWPSERVTNGRRNPICPPTVGPFALAVGAVWSLGLAPVARCCLRLAPVECCCLGLAPATRLPEWSPTLPIQSMLFSFLSFFNPPMLEIECGFCNLLLLLQPGISRSPHAAREGNQK